MNILNLFQADSMKVRSGEKQKGWFRSNRFLQINGDWFFITREMTEEGPFYSKQEAENASINYITKKECMLRVWVDSLFAERFTR